MRAFAPRGCRVIEHQRFELINRLGLGPFGQQTLREVAEKHIRAVQAFDELRRRFLRQVERRGPWSVFVAHVVQPAASPIDAGRIAISVLIAMVPIVPIENVQAAVGSRFLHDRHEPGVVGRKKILLRLAGVCRTVRVIASQLMQLPWILPMYSLPRYSAG